MKQLIVKKVKTLTTWAVGLLLFSGLTAPTAWAIPALQIYIDGATYDAISDTWVIETDRPFGLWIMGDIGSYGPISDVKLAAAVLSSEVNGSNSIGLTPTTAGDFDSISGDDDLSTPASPSATSNFPSADGALPERGDGTSLPSHGIYGAGTSFYEWALGNFTETDSPVGDFITVFPTSFPTTGQINVYTVDINGFTQVHFDTYDHIYDGDNHAKYTFAPFSHDGEVGGGGAPVPEPGSWILMGTGLVGIMVYSWRRKKLTV